jgi:hypothetical protein
LTPALLRYPEEDRYRVNQQQMRHYLLAQKATIAALAAGTIADFRTERQIDNEGDKAGIKRPDIVWLLPNGAQIAIEVELSAKWDRKLDEFIRGIATSLESEPAEPARFERVAIVTDSPAIHNRYKAAIQPGQPLTLWQKDKRAHWVIEKAIQMPTWLAEKVDFILMEEA